MTFALSAKLAVDDGLTSASTEQTGQTDQQEIEASLHR